MLVGLVGELNVCYFFFLSLSLPENEYALLPHLCVTTLREKRGRLDGKQSTGSGSGWDAAGSYA